MVAGPVAAAVPHAPGDEAIDRQSIIGDGAVMDGRFDLVLSYPQWQGSGRPEHLCAGAEAAACLCGTYGPLVRIAEAGEGEAAHGVNRWTAILQQFQAAQRVLNDGRPERVLTAGGDCSSDVAVIDYLHRRYPDLTVLWIDAHLDANTADTSPSGNFHGMPVSALMGWAPGEMQSLLGAPLATSRFRYVSAHVGDDGDWAFHYANSLRWLGAEEVIAGPVHIHFDLDALQPADFGHVAYPDGDLPLSSALGLLRSVARSAEIVGFTMTEFAPADVQSRKEGVSVLAELCEAASAR